MVERRGQGVRLSDVAAAAGVSRQALYLHFPNRTALLVATVQHADTVEGLQRRLQPYLAARTSVDKLDAYIEFWGNYIPRVFGLAKALLAVRDSDEAAAAAWQDRMDAVHARCRTIVDTLAAEGRLAPGWTPAQASDALWAMISIPAWEALTVDRRWSNAQYIRSIKHAARRTFVAAEG
jgi:AcrR family transcriptional regulator